MGYKILQLKLPTGYSDKDLRKAIRKQISTDNFRWSIEKKSLDARNKKKIRFLIRVLAESPVLSGKKPEGVTPLKIPVIKQKKRAVVVGSGPAGFFAAHILQQAGFRTTLLERGKEVGKRTAAISTFEKTAVFDPAGNYAFGEGGAGTFSDGKLTSRSKHISKERNYILQTYVDAGAPREILYMTHPHLGSDLLRRIVKKLRTMFEAHGGKVMFETKVTDLNIKGEKVLSVETDKGVTEADFFVFAIGHSAFDTYRMLMKRGVRFHPKNFALGSRMEHPQTLINKAMWGVSHLPGVKAAEYRLTSKADEQHPVYSFCMCPGGTVVPATAYEKQNIVNGMSMYSRNGKFANAAVVAGLHPGKLLNKPVDAGETLDWLEGLESMFYEKAGGYAAPFCSINDFLNKRLPSSIPETSYPMGLIAAPLWEWLPGEIVSALSKGLKDFAGKIKGFETGTLMGLESKSSAAIQVERDPNGRCNGFENLYMVGEGSGYSGGIVSSAADGVRAAIHIATLLS